MVVTKNLTTMPVLMDSYAFPSSFLKRDERQFQQLFSLCGGDLIDIAI
jgi:hypothetical protein